MDELAFWLLVSLHITTLICLDYSVKKNRHLTSQRLSRIEDVLKALLTREMCAKAKKNGKSFDS